jgi:hypothetical protein
MTSRPVWMSCLLCGVLGLGFAFAAQAQTEVGPVQIKMIRTGWNGDAVAVVTDLPVVNPAKCSTPDGYMTEIAAAGYKTHYAAILTAFAMGKKIRIVVAPNECVATRPKIWGVYVEQ